MALAASTKLGPYEIRSLLGEGGMGEVYRARDTRLQRDVAIKVLPHSFARDADRLRRFEQEARAVAALNHPNLLVMFDVGTMPLPQGGESETVPYLVSELLEGTTLRERLASGPLPERKALDYAVQIARGLAAAHDHGIVHRDIKPENIFITDDGRVKILDFGLAKLTQSDAGTGSGAAMETQAMGTRTDVVMGTAGYMAPEQLRGKTVDARSDIFSFGAVLYEMLCGRRAFTGDSGADVMSAILNLEPPEINTEKLAVSAPLERIVRRCLEKNPQQRFQSAGDLAFALQELSGVRTSSASGVMAKPEVRADRPFWLLPLVGGALLAAAILITWHVAKKAAHVDPPKFTQVTYQQGLIRSARFLHDGQTIVTASRWGSETAMGLHVGSIESVGMRSLDTPADYVASVSITDDILLISGYKSVGPGYVQVGTLSLMHYGGGAPRPVMENVQFADWEPGGKKFAIVRWVPESHIYRLEYPVGTTLYQTEGWISDPHFARDGKSIAFLDHPIFGDDMGGPAMVDLTGKVTKWRGTFASAQPLVWSSDGKELWFSAARIGTSRTLWAAAMDGSERQLMSAPNTMDIQDSLTNGRVLVNDSSERRVQMIVTPEFPQGRDFTWMNWAYGQAFSADGKQLLFGDQNVSEMYGVFLRNVDGSPAVRLGDGDPMDLSPDGKYAISRLPVTPDQIELMPTGTGDPRQLTHGKINFTTALFLTNDRILAYGNEPGHRARTFSVDLAGNVTPYTPEGTRVMIATADGKKMLVAVYDADGKRSHSVMPVDGGPSVPVSEADFKDFPLNFNLDGSAIFVEKAVAASQLELSQIDLATGKRTLLYTIVPPGIPAIQNGLQATISRDGKSYAYQYHPGLSTLYVIDGLH